MYPWLEGLEGAEQLSIIALCLAIKNSGSCLAKTVVI